MLISKELCGEWVQFSYDEHAEDCGHHISWSVYFKRDAPRTMKQRRFDSRPRFRTCFACATEEWEQRETAEAA
jgi:hypothetical protein